MRKAEDIESYLIQMEVPYETMGDGVWKIKDLGPEVMVSIADSVVAFRLKVMETAQIPQPKREAFFHQLLELNATDMLHGAYGLEQGNVVVTDALELENLDFNEFQSTLDDIGMAVSNHHRTLAKFLA